MQTLDPFINRIICGDALKALQKFPAESIDCVVTSPPYWRLRDYGGAEKQIGREPNIEKYLERLSAVFDEIQRVLKPSGSCWVVLGDTYANKCRGAGTQNKSPKIEMPGSPTRRVATSKFNPEISIPAKSLCLVPLRFAVRMIERGWILRNEIIWHKPNVLPQSVKDRFTVDYEKIFFFVKNRKYYFSQQFEPLKDRERMRRPFYNPSRKYKYDSFTQSAANKESLERSRAKILENGRNKRSVWTIGTGAFKGNHFAVFPEKLIEAPIKAGCPLNGIVLDPFAGSGTSALVARKLGRNYIGIELNPEYVKLARRRLVSILTNPGLNFGR